MARKLGQAFALNHGLVGSDSVNGSGLGLAICQGIVAAHGGSITFRSNPPQGTTFKVRLRADLRAAAQVAANGPIEQESAA